MKIANPYFLNDLYIKNEEQYRSVIREFFVNWINDMHPGYKQKAKTARIVQFQISEGWIN